MSNVFREEYFWKRVHKDLDAYLEHEGKDNELQNTWMAHYFDVPSAMVRQCWAQAREMRRKDRELAS
jgi:hypothetical protein